MRLIEINQGLGGQQEAATEVNKVALKDGTVWVPSPRCKAKA